MPGEPSNPHDALFRYVMSRSVDVAGELRAVLPAALVARVDWDSLALEPGSYVSTGLRSRYSDVLFRARIDGRNSYIYLLVEHQSRPDRFMPLRMMEYVIRIWDRFLEDNPKAKLLPAVVPVVVHNSPVGRHWNTPTELVELIDVPAGLESALGDHLPRLRLILDDLSRVDIKALRARELTPAARVMLVVQKVAPGNPNLGRDLLPLVDDLHALVAEPNGLDDLRCVVTYIFLVGETGEDELGPVIDELGPRAKEVIVTTAERLQAEGRAKGRVEGRVEGRAEALVETLTELLTIKFGPLPATAADRIRSAGNGQLQAWTRRVLTATSLDEVLDRT
ncbi:Rpn family recombination-promoting nuclease/putative transposase [Nocardia sp. CA-290969]|uniref:Rpn family recombination-promoting nuclease/putative transposase n=1 Tax=Nocardia sp. CA-290969 TaxID=3239986 RepID=UPI003D8BFC34